MIGKIQFINYKAFRQGHVSVSPISVLMGANSMGKSSILKLILMLSQTNGENKNTHALKTYGRLTDNGEVKNIFHKKDLSKEIIISFHFNKPLHTKHVLNSMRESISQTIQNEYRRKIFILHELSFQEKDTELKSILENKFNLIRHRLFDEKSDDYIYIFKETLKLDKFIDNYKIKNEVEDNFSKDRLFSAKTRDVADVYKMLDELEKIDRIVNIEYKFSYLKNKGKLVISSLKINSIKDDYIEIDFYRNRNSRRSSVVSSNLLDMIFFEKYYPVINSSFGFNGLRTQWTDPKNQPAISKEKISAAYIFYEYMKEFTKKGISEFNPSNIRHVSPVRAYPKRYYILNEGFDNGHFDTTDNDSLVLNLKDNNEIVIQVNKWLKKFGLSIKLEKLNEIIQAIRVNQNDIDLHLVDIGFGVSQILPVIIQSLLAKSGSVILIEQPEIHIHPKMQSELADFFISLAKEKNKRFIIETHSEAFLKRLRRRMAEHSKNLPYSISPQDVSIHYIERDEKLSGNSVVVDKEISASGDFEWPKEFMANDVEDTIEFMKHQD